MVFETNGVWVQAPERFVQDEFNILSKKTLEAMGGTENKALMPGGRATAQVNTFLRNGFPASIFYWQEMIITGIRKRCLTDKNLKFVFVNDAAAPGHGCGKRGMPMWVQICRPPREISMRAVIR